MQSGLRIKHYLLVVIIIFCCILTGCNKKSYQVTFDLNGGTTTNETVISVKSSDEIKLFEPTKQDYEFMGWLLNGKKYTNQKITSNITLVASWQKIVKYTITFDLNGGTTTNETCIEVKEGTTFETFTPVKEDYLFLGWTLNNEPYEKMIVVEDMVLVANWEKIFKYTITLDLNGGTTTNKTTIRVEPNEVFELFIPQKENSEFLGWYLDDKLFEKTTTDKDIKLTALWFEPGVIYNIIYEPNEGILPNDVKYQYTTGITFTLPIPSKMYYDFDGWYLNADFTGQPITELDDHTAGKILLFAKWKEGSSFKTITYYLDGGSIKEDSAEKYIEGVKFILPTCKKSGFFFRGYYDNNQFDGTPIYVLDENQRGNISLYAYFVEAIASNMFVSIIGDSISTFEGTIPTEYPTYYPVGDVTKVEDMWWKIAADSVSAQILSNNSSSGSRVSQGADMANSVERLQKLSDGVNRPDLVIIFIGINDCTRGVNRTTFNRHYREMLDKIYNMYDDVNIWMCDLPSNTYSGPDLRDARIAYNETISQIAYDYEINLIQFSKLITEENKFTYNYAGPHFNLAGMKLIAKTVATNFRKYYT